MIIRSVVLALAFNSGAFAADPASPSKSPTLRSLAEAAKNLDKQEQAEVAPIHAQLKALYSANQATTAGASPAESIKAQQQAMKATKKTANALRKQEKAIHKKYREQRKALRKQRSQPQAGTAGASTTRGSPK